MSAKRTPVRASGDDVAACEASVRLLRRATEDPEALGALYDLHAPALLILAERVLGSRGEAEDLVHDVFLEVWQRLSTYDPRRGSVSTWLRVRLRSRAIDRLRAQATRRSMVREASVEALPHASVDSVRPAAEHESDRQRLFATIEGMTDLQREVLALAYFEGLTQREIAERVGIPVGTVKSRLAGAVDSLRRHLGAGRDGPAARGGGAAETTHDGKSER